MTDRLTFWDEAHPVADDSYLHEMAGHECAGLAGEVVEMIDRHGLTLVADALRVQGYALTPLPPKASPVTAATADMRVPF